jgi:hypothetical protein
MNPPLNTHRHPDIQVTHYGPDYEHLRTMYDEAIRYGESEYEYHVVPAKTDSDGASVPWVFRRLFPRIGGRHFAAALMHDWLYATGLLPRDVADLHFRQAMLYNGVPGWQAWSMYLGVRWGGWVAWRGHHSKETPHGKA